MRWLKIVLAFVVVAVMVAVALQTWLPRSGTDDLYTPPNVQDASDTTRAAPASPVPGERPDSAVSEPSTPSTAGLIIPVQGIGRDQLQDTFNDARSEGREHNAIDIMAAKGTPVLAAADGKLLRLFNSEKGGKTLYQLAGDGRTVLYYAHLDNYATGLQQDAPLKQGQVIGYVGDTGNSTPGNYHLHFAMWTVEDPTKFWDGPSINPYPLLTH